MSIVSICQIATIRYKINCSYFVNCSYRYYINENINNIKIKILWKILHNNWSSGFPFFWFILFN